LPGLFHGHPVSRIDHAIINCPSLSAWQSCGSISIIVTGRTYTEARAAAIHREIELREIELVDVDVCTRIVAIGPDGEPVSPQMLSEVLPAIGGE
jgi:hypothetical protein